MQSADFLEAFYVGTKDLKRNSLVLVASVRRRFRIESLLSLCFIGCEKETNPDDIVLQHLKGLEDFFQLGLLC